MKSSENTWARPVSLSLPTAATLFALAAAAATPARAQGINVTVNGDLVAFPGQVPVQRAGTVLVPLRGVFEKMGANVLFDNSTKTIVAIKGATNISLRLGESAASVNGEQRALSVPASAVGGTTLVPLRFVSEALGADVRWQAASRTVIITTGAQTAGNLPSPRGTGSVTGTITGIFPESNSLSLRVSGGQNTQIPLSEDTVVLVRSGEGPATAATLSSLRAGDQITVRRDREGRATVLEATYGERRGEVKSVQRLPSGNYIVTLSDGSVVEVLPDAAVSQAGRSIQLTDVRAGERVVIRLNPTSQQGTGIAVVTGDNPSPTPPGRVEVTSFRQSGTRALRSGETLTATLTGTPGAQGTFSIPGIEGAQNLPLRETSPGTYVGTYTIPEGVNVRDVSVLGQLKIGQAASPIIQTGNPLTIDAAGPTLSNLSPEEGASLQPGRPLIYGTYSDAGTGVDANATRLIVNGKDVTAQATITGAFFNYTPTADLPTGRNTATIIARDAAGNETRREWAFTIAGTETIIKSLTFSPNTQTLEAGDVLTVRMEAPPGGVARFAVGGAITDRPMQEQASGVYVGTYTVKRGDSLAKAPVAVSFTLPGDRTVTQTAAQSVTIAAGAPNTPVIDTPQEGAKVGGTVTVTGRATPGATVRYSLRYQGRLLILSTSGTVAEGEVKADAQGRWTVADIRLSAPLGVSNLSYSLQAVTLDATGSESEPATVNFTR